MKLQVACLAMLPCICASLPLTVAAAGSFQVPAPFQADRLESGASPQSVRQSYLGETHLQPAATTERHGAASLSPMVPYDREEQIIRAVDGSGLGISVAVSGDVALVGAFSTSGYQGAVYVYKRTSICNAVGVCNWVQIQRLVASDASNWASFGFSVAFDGDTALIGAPGTSVAGNPNQGAVYVFVRGTTRSFTQVQKLTAPDGVASDCYFGRSVAVVDEDALVGAPGCGGVNQVINSHGSAYRYRKEANGTWAIAQKLVASDGGFAEEFGGAVALSADTAIIGAVSAFQFAHYDVGAVYVYEKQCFTDGCNPAWLERQKLVGSPTSTGMWLGRSIAFDGTSLLVGAEFALTGDENDPVQRSSGAVYAYAKVGGQWVQTQQLLAGDADRNWRFGASIAMSGDTLVVGASGAGWPDSRGAAYVFERSGGTWSEVEKLTASDSTNNDYFGDGVGISGSGAVIVGAHQGLNNSGQGTLYIYEPE